MWVTLPPVVSVATAADELVGVSMVAHTSGMMYESNISSCPPSAPIPITCSRPSRFGASPAMAPHSAIKVCGEHRAPTSDPQCGPSNRVTFLPPVVSDGASCETATPAAGGAWSKHPGSHGTQPALLQLHQERHSFYPLAFPPSVGTSAPISTSLTACASSVSAASQYATASPGQDALGDDLSKNPCAASLTEAAAVGTCQCASSPCVCTPSFHQVQLRSSSPELPMVLVAAANPAVCAPYTAAAMPPSGSWYAVPKATPPTNSPAAVVPAPSAPAATTNGPDASHAALRRFTEASRAPLIASATVTASGEVSTLSGVASRYDARNHQMLGPLVVEPHPTPLASAPTPTPNDSSIPSGSAPLDSSLFVSSFSLRGGTGGSGDLSCSVRTPSLTTPLLTSSSPPMQSREYVSLRSQYVPPPSLRSVGGMSLDASGTTFTVSTTGVMAASFPQTPPGPQSLTFTHPGNSASASASASASDLGHLHAQSLSTARASPPRHLPPPAHPSCTSSGTESAGAGMPSMPPDDTFSVTAPTNHNQSFYMGTSGNENLRRSFFFPLSEPGGAAVAADSVENLVLMGAGGSEPVFDMTSYARPTAAACGCPVGQATSSTAAVGGSWVTAYGVGDAGPPSGDRSVLPDPYRSPMLLEALPLQSVSQQPHEQNPLYPSHPQAQQSLQTMLVASATTQPIPVPQLTIFSQSPQVTSLHGSSPGLAQSLGVSHTFARDTHSSLRQPPAKQQLFAGDLSSSCVAGGATVEGSRDAAVSDASFISPTLADLQWQRRFKEPLSVTEKALTHTHSGSQTTGHGAATPAAGGEGDGTNARPPSVTSNNVILRPAYIVDWEQSLTAFQNRAESYYSFKNVCTETYLTLIEHCVDRFLVFYFSGGALRPEESLQEALASRTRALSSISAHILSGTSAGSLNKKGLSGAVAGGGGIQKVLQSSKTLQKLSETGSKWLTKIGANLRRSAATSAQVSSEPQAPPMSVGSVSRGTATFAGPVARPQRRMGDGSPDSRITPMTIGAAVTATSGRERRELECVFTSTHDADQFPVSATPSTTPGRLPSPTMLDSISSASTTPPLSGSLSYTAPTKGTSSAASTTAVALSVRVTAEEAELQCLRQLGPYVANVVPETFMDVRPSDDVLAQVRRNYTILLHTLQHVLLDDSSRTERIADASLSDVDPGLLPPTTLSHTPSPLSSTALVGSPPPTTVDELIFQRIRQGLVLPTIQATWRDYLAPLQCKVQELMQIAKTSIGPILGELQATCDASVTGGAPSVSLMATELPERGLPHNSTAAFTSLNGASTPFNAMTDAERAAREALRASCEVPINRLIRLLRGDEEYLSAIHAMDEGFVENGAAWRELSAQMRLRGAALSNYVPVYGLVLSRLHRLEMEHRTVLELWGGETVGAQYRVHAQRP